MSEQPMPMPESTAPQPGQPEQAPPPEKFPVGVILIIILTGFGIVGGLMGLVNPMIMIGTVLITGLPAFVFNLIQETAYIALFIWLLKRKERGRVLGMVISAYNMLFVGIQFVVAFTRPDELMRTMDQMTPGYSDLVPSSFFVLIMGGSAILGWIIGTAVIAYLYFKKHYFRP